LLEQFETSKDAWARADICTLLGAVGSKKSIPVLEKAVMDENWMVNGNARKALSAVKSRKK
jgi:HEAT repeat protein